MLLKSFAGGRSILPLAFFLSLGVIAQPLLAVEHAHTVSPVVEKANDLGPADPAEELTLTVHLQLHNQAAFDEAVDKLYDPESPTYHHWMTDADIAKYAPSAAELKAVQQELQKHGLSVISSDEYSVRVHGSAANVAAAFQTQFHNLSFKGKTFRAHIQDAKLTGAAGSLVGSIAGLDQHTVKPMLKRVVNPRTGQSFPSVKMSKVLANGGGLGAYIFDYCLAAPAEQTYVTPGASLPIGVYYGNVYNLEDAKGRFCDFTPAQLQGHYGLKDAYVFGLDGTGQTVVLLEAYGYPTAESDANAFFKLAGLPLLDSSNFEIVYPDGKPNPQAGILTGWDIEIALDIQWAHSMAPKAKIVLVASNGQDSEDFQYAMNYIVKNKLGTVVSDSWEEDTDLISGPQEQNSYTTVLKAAAAKGVSFQFSSGDGGDEGLGTPIGAAGVPANNPYATAVGGTSILNNNGGPGLGFWELGWGDTLTYISEFGVADPPLAIGNIGGAGGGESVYFKKPAWQSKLPGSGRQVPDISALADPYTGVPIVVTQDLGEGPQPYLEAGWGGTSLASPIITGILAIATQAKGKPLGQAAPLIAALPAGAMRDVLPVSSPTNVFGTVVDSAGPFYYSPASLFQPYLYTTEGFVSANWLDAPGPDGLAADGLAIDFGFGIDSSLTVTTGWDNVTGFGVPNGLSFIKALAK
jgi:subtilase family serine protease